MGIESGSSRTLLESTGWLAAHRRNQAWLRQNPVDLHMSSFTGGAALENASTTKRNRWLAWSFPLFGRGRE
ncbi:MAG: hypothetical protein JJE48_04265 [Actinobacteria bacterium]|nr:hypothetical protein [Actinomycetota bacterium]